MKKKIIIYIVSAIFFFGLSDAVSASGLRSDSERHERIRYLQGVVDSIKEDIGHREDLIAKERSPQMIHVFSMEIADLRVKLEAAEKDFIDYAADSNIFESDTHKTPSPKNLVEDFQEVVTPVVSTLKRASERPRRIEKLRSEIDSLNLKMKQAEKGLSSIDDLISNTNSEALRQRLVDAREQVEKFRSKTNFRLGVLKDQLEEELQDNKSFIQSAGDMLEKFFSDKGMNLLIALLTIAITLLLLFAFEKLVLRPYLYASKAHFISKPVESLFSVIAVVISLAFGLLSLYILDDWFLFTLMLLIMLGIGWSLKHLIVRFIDAIKLMFGFGTVKIGQRINYEGCPWKVKKISMNTILENDLLEGGVLNIDITKIMGLSSRRMHSDEPLFPTRKGDWVLLSDGVYGKVALQTPEQVMVEMNGVTPCFYRTQDFISLRPQNLSKGFVVEFSLGLDYKHQKDISSIIDTFKEQLKDTKVYFNKAGAHSLDINFETFFDGKAAAKYKELSGSTQRAVVDICTKKKYEIAFEQLQVRVK